MQGSDDIQKTASVLQKKTFNSREMWEFTTLKISLDNYAHRNHKNTAIIEIYKKMEQPSTYRNY